MFKNKVSLKKNRSRNKIVLILFLTFFSFVSFSQVNKEWNKQQEKEKNAFMEKERKNMDAFQRQQEKEIKKMDRDMLKL